MTIHWLQPIAFWGLALVALPVLVHFLVRQHSRRVLFPSLRFVRGTRLSAVRRRFINEWLLLAIRAAAIAAAVLALAGPVAISDSRNEAWRARVTHAIVVAGDATTPGLSDAVTAERQASVSSALFTATRTADAVRDAAHWLQQQPISSKEIVVIGDVRVGAMSSSIVQAIPHAFGLRFLPFATAVSARSVHFAGVMFTDSRTPSGVRIAASFDEYRTRVAYRPDTAIDPPVRVRAAAADQTMAEAALAAMWANAPIIEPGDRPVVVIFDGGDDSDLQPIQTPADAAWMRGAVEGLYGMRGGQSREQLVVYTAISPNDNAAPALLAHIAGAALAPDLRSLEPRRIPVADLARWSRPPSPELDSTVPVDEGDRRWLWGVALALLAIEHIARRGPRGERQIAVALAGNQDEQRVA